MAPSRHSWAPTPVLVRRRFRCRHRCCCCCRALASWASLHVAGSLPPTSPRAQPQSKETHRPGCRGDLGSPAIRVKRISCTAGTFSRTNIKFMEIAMNTLLKTSYLACSIAVALGTNAAHAVVPTTTPGLVVYSGGGSAEPQPVEAAFCKLFNNVDLYSDLQKAQSGSYLVLYGTAINTIGSIPAGTNFLFFYKFNGGSYPNGGIPQAGTQSAAGAAQQLNFPSTASVLGSAALLTAGTQGTVCTAAQKGLPTYGYTPVVGSNLQVPDF